jgi:exopolysaccharide biosynthesis polyprenyl glycosylphosphotransferase
MRRFLRCLNLSRFAKRDFIMEKRRNTKYLLKDFFIIMFFLVEIGVFFKIWGFYQPGTMSRNTDKYWTIVLSYTIFLCVFSKTFKVFEIGHRPLMDILFGQFTTISLSNFLIYLQLCMIENWPYHYSIKVILLITALDFVIIIIESCLLQFIYFLLTPVEDAIFITSNDKTLEKDLKQNRLDKRFIIKETIRTDLTEDEILKRISKYKIIIIDDIQPPKLRNNILKYCFANDKKMYSKPKVSDIIIRSGNVTKLCYNSMMVWNARKITIEQAFIKRAFDIVVSFSMLLVLSPLMLLIALGVKLTDGGPILFKQLRYTKNERKFTIYKFRSMYVQDTKEIQMTRKNDVRITPIGRIIRKTHLDELPQLINILKGDMSIVGPRPEMVELYDMYAEKYPEFHYRSKVKAGLTGYAQVYGKYNTSPHDKIKFDLIYIANFSLLLDLKLILLTVKVMFKEKTSEGIEQNEKTSLK